MRTANGGQGLGISPLVHDGVMVPPTSRPILFGWKGEAVGVVGPLDGGGRDKGNQTHGRSGGDTPTHRGIPGTRREWEFRRVHLAAAPESVEPAMLRPSTPPFRTSCQAGRFGNRARGKGCREGPGFDRSTCQPDGMMAARGDGRQITGLVAHAMSLVVTVVQAIRRRAPRPIRSGGFSPCSAQQNRACICKHCNCVLRLPRWGPRHSCSSVSDINTMPYPCCARAGLRLRFSCLPTVFRQ